MTLFFSFIAILQSFSISLGVGSSTLAIINFFTAIADGTIDDTERRMMGVVYVVLRVAMVAILITTVLLTGAKLLYIPFSQLGAFTFGQMTVLFVLYLNAALMTAHLMPSTFGPAIQAGSWYTLGTLAALAPLGVTTFNYLEFLVGYITWVVLAVAIVNGTMAIMKHKRK